MYAVQLEVMLNGASAIQHLNRDIQDPILFRFICDSTIGKETLLHREIVSRRSFCVGWNFHYKQSHDYYSGSSLKV